ncbi:MAG: 23S rRNA (cytidine(2498)-2'-O)-methyltransferase RlmM [Gammaproteobacteria bacterium]
MNTLNQILLYCRPGFEKEVAAEIMHITRQADIYGFIKSKPDSGYVVFHSQPPVTYERLNEIINFNHLVFARQCLLATDIINNLPSDNRITPLMSCIQSLALTFNDLLLETPDSNEGKQLSGFLKKFSTPLLMALKQAKLIDKTSPWRLHGFFLSSSAVYLGLSHIHNSSPQLMGIPRLRMPKNAPSRSTLKLEEAFKTMLDESEQLRYLQNGMSAVDLGASPGGWTWQLVQRSMMVVAIDNGPMDQALMDSGQVQHIKADGFKYRPEKPVDWLVCDMVERPLHISRMISRWLVEGHCRHTAFNLKLPMKQRYDIVQQCRELIEAKLDQAGIRYNIRIKQLYHDREEVTVIITQS